MSELKVQIIEFVDASQPGWVRCSFSDAFGREKFFTEKVPIVTVQYLSEKSIYPQKGSVSCTIEGNIADTQQHEIITINTDIPLGISTEDGQTIFKVFRNQIE